MTAPRSRARLRLRAWALGLGTALAASAGGQATPEPPQPAAVALAHRFQELTGALQAGNPEAVREAQLQVEALRRTYGTRDLTPLVEGMALWARDEGRRGRPALGQEGLQAVERWAPDHPSLLGTRIELQREQGPRGWVTSLPDLLRLTRLRWTDPDLRWAWVTAHLAHLRLGALLLAGAWTLALVLRYRNALRDLWESGAREAGLPPAAAAALGALALAAPAVLGLGPAPVLLLWLVLLAPLQTPSEVRGSLALGLLLAVPPLLSVAEPWAFREPLPSLVSHQLQPRVWPVAPASLAGLPEEDRAFLRGWAQLQAQDWRGAEATFQGLVAHMPDQAEVLNNLGVARFQAGDAAGAERAFASAQVVAPRAEVLLNQSILAFRRLDTALGAARQDEAQAASPATYAQLVSMNDARRDPRTYPIPLPDTPARQAALAQALTPAAGRPPGFPPGLLLALALPLVGLGAMLLRLRGARRLARPAQCLRCGDPFGATDSPDPDVCTQCHHLFVLRDGVHAESRLRKLESVARHQRWTRRLHRLLAALLPGADRVFMGEGTGALGELLTAALAAGMVLTMGAPVRYPGEVLLEPASTWLPLGVLVLGLLYLRSWMKLLPGRA